jgi:SPP1 gp7 family putative phage head morphogenesis protein
MSSNQFLIDAATRHQIFLQRYGSGRSKEAVRLLNQLRRKLNARLSQEPENIQAQRLSDLLKDITSISKIGFEDIKTLVSMGVLDLAKSEARFSAEMISRATTISLAVPTEAALITALQVAPMVGVKGVAPTIAESLSKFGASKIAQIVQTITDGVVTGTSTPKISRTINSLVSTLIRRQITSLVSTIINHVSSVTRKETYKQNDKYIDKYEWVSTLDGRTTFVCMARDGQIYNLAEGPMPPAHFGCRSTTIPKIRPEFDLGFDTKGTRPSLGSEGPEQVSTKTTYSGWLRTQNREFIDEALGVERSRLFRAGSLTLDKFVDPTGRVYTLKQLESMNPIVFSDL